MNLLAAAIASLSVIASSPARADQAKSVAGDLAQTATKDNAAQTPSTTEFVLVNGGTFTMGSPSSEAGRRDDEIQHRVTVSSFYMASRELGPVSS